MQELVMLLEISMRGKILVDRVPRVSERLTDNEQGFSCQGEDVWTIFYLEVIL